MAKLHCKIPVALDRVIARARIRHGSKGKALKEIVKLALDDSEEFKPRFPYGKDEKVSCTLNMGEGEYKDTYRYRERYELLTKTQFFMFVLQHGARRWEEKNPPQNNNQ